MQPKEAASAPGIAALFGVAHPEAPAPVGPESAVVTPLLQPGLACRQHCKSNLLATLRKTSFCFRVRPTRQAQGMNVSIVRLTAPWPPSLGRISPRAARAVRTSSPNASEVTFAVPDDERRNLLALPGGRVVVAAIDASAFYEARASEEMAELTAAAAAAAAGGRRLQGRRPFVPGVNPMTSVPLTGSMAGYFTCATLPFSNPLRPSTSIYIYYAVLLLP